MKFFVPMRIGGLGGGVRPRRRRSAGAAAAAAADERRGAATIATARRDAAHRHASAAGSVNEKTLPSPGRLVTQIRPPCWATMRSQIARPMPVPG